MNELTVYLQTNLVDIVEEDNTNFDLLAWWKASKTRFLVLSTISRDLLTIPLSTVASEQSFS